MKNLNLKRFGSLIDCSRNAVMNIEGIKQWIDLISELGFNSLMVYTEDTYEVNGHPYFGYGRGSSEQSEFEREYIRYNRWQNIVTAGNLAISR